MTQPVTFDQIEPKLASILKNANQQSDPVEYVVLLQADKSLNLQHVIDVIDIGNKLHVKMLLFVEKT